jgi:hypothetical protein
MGKAINNLWVKQDGAATKWTIAAGAQPRRAKARTWRAIRRWSSSSCSR